ncbi:hypothetical protein SSS_09574 [Sarcoptes scabiei]|nr:hypothetical protein SSS_09574 [Sarcoptes scabiei]
MSSFGSEKINNQNSTIESNFDFNIDDDDDDLSLTVKLKSLSKQFQSDSKDKDKTLDGTNAHEFLDQLLRPRTMLETETLYSNWSATYEKVRFQRFFVSLFSFLFLFCLSRVFSLRIKNYHIEVIEVKVIQERKK